jgi:hypothetical protein
MLPIPCRQHVLVNHFQRVVLGNIGTQTLNTQTLYQKQPEKLVLKYINALLTGIFALHMAKVLVVGVN